MGAILAIYYSNRSHCLRIAFSVLVIYSVAPDMLMFRAMSILQQNNIINAINWVAQALVSVLAFPMR